MLRGLDGKRLTAKGEEEVTLLLRMVHESSNGATALKLPILQAVSRFLHPDWVEKASALFDALDRINLLELHATLVGLGLADHFAVVLRKRLTEILGPPVEPRPRRAA